MAEEKVILEVQADIGRDYADPPGIDPHFTLSPLPKGTGSADFATRFEIRSQGRTLTEDVYVSHLALLKLYKQYDFQTVLDIGSGAGSVSRILRFLGKTVTTVEPLVDPTADYTRDVLDIDFPDQFDCVWASHVLEHIRNPGLFLDKIFDALKPGGVLAITIPYNDGAVAVNTLLIGHCYKFNDLSLIYQLICAGFDCRRVAVKVYGGQVSVILRKAPNGLPRVSHALFGTPPAQGAPGKGTDSLADLPDIYTYFPFTFTRPGGAGTLHGMNWRFEV